jgi:hypothetical protein
MPVNNRRTTSYLGYATTNIRDSMNADRAYFAGQSVSMSSAQLCDPASANDLHEGISSSTLQKSRQGTHGGGARGIVIRHTKISICTWTYSQ